MTDDDDLVLFQVAVQLWILLRPLGILVLLPEMPGLL